MKARSFIFCVVMPLYAVQNSVAIDLVLPADGSVTPDTRSSSDPLVSHTQDSSIPLPTYFSWSIRGNTTPALFDMSLSEDSLFDTSDFSEKGLTDTFLLVWNLKIDTRYYWEVSARDGQNKLVESAIGSFTTSPAWPRMLRIDGTTNVRDIGGRKTPDGFLIRQGMLYRSAEFNVGHPITEKGMEQLKQLHIACDIDLRKAEESPQPALPDPVRYFHPVNDSGNGIYQYKDGLISTADLYGKVFKVLADQRNYPVALHCRGGADRTATVVAILEALLGCSEQQMGEDYQWTSLSVFDLRDTTLDQWKGTISYLKSFDVQGSTVQAGACYYLLKQGLTIDDIVSIRKIFINNNQSPIFTVIKNRSQFPAKNGKLHFFDRSPFSHHPLLTLTKGIRSVSLFNCQGKTIFKVNVHTDAANTLGSVGPGVYFVQYR
jgi:hypothetical protein